MLALNKIGENMKNLTPEMAIITDILKDIKHYYSIMYTISKKIINDFPTLSQRLKEIIEEIEKKELMINVNTVDDPMLKSKDFYELVGYVQNIGETSVVKLEYHLQNLREAIKNMPKEKQTTMNFIRFDVYEKHKVTIGTILNEVNRMISSHFSTPI